MNPSLLVPDRLLVPYNSQSTLLPGPLPNAWGTGLVMPEIPPPQFALSLSHSLSRQVLSVSMEQIRSLRPREETGGPTVSQPGNVAGQIRKY